MIMDDVIRDIASFTVLVSAFASPIAKTHIGPRTNTMNSKIPMTLLKNKRRLFIKLHQQELDNP